MIIFAPCRDKYDSALSLHKRYRNNWYPCNAK